MGSSALDFTILVFSVFILSWVQEDGSFQFAPEHIANEIPVSQVIAKSECELVLWE